jgi:hypothetical protein
MAVLLQQDLANIEAGLFHFPSMMTGHC